MSVRSFCRALALLACLLSALPVTGAAQDAAPPSPAGAGAEAEQVARAKALMDEGRFMETVQLLGPLVEGRVIQADTLFLYGRAALEASQQPGVPDGTRQALLDQAIASFHAMLVKAPGAWCGCGWSLPAPSSSGASTHWRAGISSRCLAGRAAAGRGRQCRTLPARHAHAAALAGAFRRGHSPGQQCEHGLRRSHDLPRFRRPAPPVHATGRHRAEIRPRPLALGRGRIPVSARAALAAALRGERLHPRIQGRGLSTAIPFRSIWGRAG